MQTRRQIFSPCALLIASVFARLAPAQRGSQPAPLLPATTRYIFNVTVVQKATDCFGKSGCIHTYMLAGAPVVSPCMHCFLPQPKSCCCAEKSVLVVNGEHNKQIEVVQGSTLEARLGP